MLHQFQEPLLYHLYLALLSPKLHLPKIAVFP